MVIIILIMLIEVNIWTTVFTKKGDEIKDKKIIPFHRKKMKPLFRRLRKK